MAGVGEVRQEKYLEANKVRGMGGWSQPALFGNPTTHKRGLQQPEGNLQGNGQRGETGMKATGKKNLGKEGC